MKKRRIRDVKRRQGVALLVACLFLLCGCSGLPPMGGATPTPPASTAIFTPAADSLLSVHVINVGQGDCILLQSGGETMLIDAGTRGNTQTILTYLSANGVESLTYAVATHPHEDHIGGFPGIIAAMPIGTFWLTDAVSTSAIFQTMLDALDTADIQVAAPAAGQEIRLGHCTVQVLGPARTYGDLNNMSLVLRVEAGAVSFLFTGDMEASAEADLLSKVGILPATVLKVGHHGSNTSTSAAFLAAVQPQIAVISAGAGNSYGHPHAETMAALAAQNVTVYRTDTDGSIVLDTNGTMLTVTREKDADAGRPAPPTAGQGAAIGNKNSRVVHGPGCDALPSEQNRVYFASLQEALDQGYRICGKCNGE